MIVRKTLSVRRIIQYTGKETLLFTFVALIVTLCYLNCPEGLRFLTMEPVPLSLIGSALTIFLGFRTNSAYQRWWEARILWGGIVNQSRNFGRQILSFTEPAAEFIEEVERFEREMLYLQMAFVHATRCHLRRQDPFPEIEPFISRTLLDDLRTEQNVPAALLHRMGLRLKAAGYQKFFDNFRFLALQSALNELTNLLGGCERIKNTSLPRQYDVFPRIFVWIFNSLLPFALVKPLHWYTPLICACIAFIFIAVDQIGANIENPFENSIHDTPMSSLSRTIEINLRQMLGEKDLPPRVEPVDGYLY